MRKEISYIPIALLLMLVASMLTAIPARAFVYPDGSKDTLDELYGPHINYILCDEFSNNVAEYSALSQGTIDFCDTPLTTSWRTTDWNGGSGQGFKNDPNVLVISAGGQYNYYVIDFNLDNSSLIPNPVTPPARPNPVWNNLTSAAYPAGIPPITTNVDFRLACASLFNATLHNQNMGAGFIPILSPIPSYMAGWIDTSLTPYTIDDKVAENFLNQGCIYNDTGSGWYWDYAAYVAGGYGVSNTTHNPALHNPPAPAETQACGLMFIGRADSNRDGAAQLMVGALQRMGFSFNRDYGLKLGIGGTEAYGLFGLEKHYLMATLGWTMVGPNPDFLFSGYNGANFYDDPSAGCPNQLDLDDYWLNIYSYNIMYATDATPAVGHDAYDNCISFQQRFHSICPEITLNSPNVFMASSKCYTGGNNYAHVGGGDPEDNYRNQTWLGVVNQASVGTGPTWFTYLNGYPNGSLYGSGNMTARMGWSGGTGFPIHLNPVYSEWAWDAYVLGWIYDAPGYRDPYNLAQWKPDLVKDWSTSSWLDPVSGTTKTAVTMTIRPDVYWSDGVPMTIQDLVFSLVQCGPLMVSMHMTPPWWWPTAEMVQSLTVVSPDTVTILFNAPSCWALGWALGGFYIIPTHIWKPLILGGVNMVQYAPDPNLIASGPFRYVSHTPTTCLLTANRVGSTVTTDNPDSTSPIPPKPIQGRKVATTSSMGYHNYEPVYVEKSLPAKVYVTPPQRWITGTFNVTLLNKCWNVTLIGNKSVWIDGVLQTDPHSNPITLVPYVPDVEPFNYNFSIGLHTIKAQFVITGPGTFTLNGYTYTNPWIGHTITDPAYTYTTIPEDIGANTYYDDIGWGNYSTSLKAMFPTSDFVVDGGDLAQAAYAFGSYPGHPRWDSTTDVNHDFVSDGADLAQIATMIGWPGA